MEHIKEVQKELFTKLVGTDVNEHTEKKEGLTYLSWAWAWQEFKKACPDAVYEVKKFTNEQTGETKPYIEDPALGFMVFTSITADGITHEMWLPVMNGANKAMKREPYTYQTKYGEKSVEPCTMFDVNKTIMRCLTKNIAMFGLGLYIYAGEDLPQVEIVPCTQEQVNRMRELKVNEINICRRFKVESIEALSLKDAEFIIASKEKSLAEGNNEG